MRDALADLPLPPCRGRHAVHDTTLQVVSQAVSAFAVAVGLVYAASQFRGWRTAQYVANFTKLVELQPQLRKMVVDDPTLAPVGLALPPGDHPEDTRGYFYNLMQLSLFEIAWFSHQRGQLPDDYFASWVTHMSAIATRPAFQTMWRSDRNKILHEGFRQHMEQVMAHAIMPESVVLHGDRTS
jgi:Family of unknown function (DUF6082)